MLHTCILFTTLLLAVYNAAWPIHDPVKSCDKDVYLILFNSVFPKHF